MTLTYDLSHSTTIVRTIFSLTYNMQNTICTLGACIIMYMCIVLYMYCPVFNMNFKMHSIVNILVRSLIVTFTSLYPMMQSTSI